MVEGVEIERDGVRHVGAYETYAPGLICVSYRGRSKTTQIGGSPPATLAKLLLGELVREAAAAEGKPHPLGRP